MDADPKDLASHISERDKALLGNDAASFGNVKDFGPCNLDDCILFLEGTFHAQTQLLPVTLSPRCPVSVDAQHPSAKTLQLITSRATYATLLDTILKWMLTKVLEAMARWASQTTLMQKLKPHHVRRRRRTSRIFLQGNMPKLRMKLLRSKDWLRIPKFVLGGPPQGGAPLSLARLCLPGPALLFQHPEEAKAKGIMDVVVW
jgi:hypothetical protein